MMPDQTLGTAVCMTMLGLTRDKAVFTMTGPVLAMAAYTTTGRALVTAAYTATKGLALATGASTTMADLALAMEVTEGSSDTHEHKIAIRPRPSLIPDHAPRPLAYFWHIITTDRCH